MSEAVAKAAEAVKESVEKVTEQVKDLTTQEPSEPVILGEDGQPLSKKALKKLQKEQEKQRKKEEKARQLAEEKAQREREAAANDTAKENYGKLPLIQSASKTGVPRTKLEDLSEADDGKEVLIRARVHNSRQQGATLVFLTLRQQAQLIQALAKSNAEGTISKQMVKWIGSVNPESIVLVKGVVKKVEEPIKSATVQTLAHQLALGQRTKHDLVDEGYNRYAFRDTENLPEWFLEDERPHSKINRPITKEAAIAIKEKMKALNARPIKKVAEAKARKAMRAVARLEKIKKKAGLINDDGDKSEKDKADEIAKLMRKVTKKQKQKPKVTLVVATGKNRGLSGRPKGVKGKYKMVDGVLKNEQRALKRIAKKHHKKK